MPTCSTGSYRSPPTLRPHTKASIHVRGTCPTYMSRMYTQHPILVKIYTLVCVCVLFGIYFCASVGRSVPCSIFLFAWRAACIHCVCTGWCRGKGKGYAHSTHCSINIYFVCVCMCTTMHQAQSGHTRSHNTIIYTGRGDAATPAEIPMCAAKRVARKLRRQRHTSHIHTTHRA